MRRGPSRESFLKKKMKRLSTKKFFKSEAIPGASRLRNQNEILIEKSDEALIRIKIKKPKILSRIRRFTRREAIQLFPKFAKQI